MKLIICRECTDVVRLISASQRSCLCGKSGGQYLADEINAVFFGPCVPLGFDGTLISLEGVMDVVVPEQVDSVRLVEGVPQSFGSALLRDGIRGRPIEVVSEKNHFLRTQGINRRFDPVVLG